MFKVPTDRNTIQISRGLNLGLLFFVINLLINFPEIFFSNVSLVDFENIFAFWDIFGTS